MAERHWAEEALHAMDESVLGPDLAPSYVDTSPLGIRERVHVITALEEA